MSLKTTIAKEIVSDYIAKFKPQVEPQDLMRNGQVFITLNGGVVVVSDSEDAPVVYSANLNASPQLIALEAAWIAQSHQGQVGVEHCQDPATGIIAEGAEEAMNLYIQIRIRESKGIVEQMVEEAKATRAQEGDIIVSDKPTIEI